MSVALAEVPESAAIYFATTPRLDSDPELNPEIGPMLYEGRVVGEHLHITEMSPVVDRAKFDAALAFVQDLIRRANVSGEDERSILIPASTAFRHQFAGLWPMDE